MRRPRTHKRVFILWDVTYFKRLVDVFSTRASAEIYARRSDRSEKKFHLEIRDLK